MTVVVTHSTPSDGSFSATGATAWDANHTLSGVGTMAEQNSNNVTITGGSISGVSGVVTSVTGTAPVVSSGGATPAISMAAASALANGYLTSTDWSTFNGKGSGTVTSVAATVPAFLSVTGSPITSSGTLTIAYSGTALPLANGGTAATTAPAAQANLLGYTTTATAAGTTTLTNTSSFYQLFTGATTQTVVLPVTSTLQTGWSFRINNSSTGALTVNSSDGSLVVTVVAGATVMCTCIDTTVATAAGWRVGTTEIAAVTGTGNMVLSSAPTLVGMTVTGGVVLTGSTASNATFATALTTATTIIGGTNQTGTITFGRSTNNQTTDFQAGVTASGNTKTINFGTNGASGSTTSIAIGSATAGATSTTTVNGAFNYANKAVTVTSNAGTVPVSAKLNTFTNSSPAATMAITMAVTGAVDGQMTMVRIYDSSAATQTIGWTNTENSTVSVPTTSNGSTTSPLTVGFMYNSQNSKWRCIALA